jgi:rhodanese-related sulfurtransferase
MICFVPTADSSTDWNCPVEPLKEGTVAMDERPPRQVFTYRVNMGAGEQDVVSLIEPAFVFEHGLCPEAVLGVLTPGSQPADMYRPECFRQNPAFVSYLGELMAAHILNEAELVREAHRQAEGLVVVVDGRTPTPGDHVPAEDIIGAVDVNAGELVPGSYQHNPNHQLLTMNGYFVLPSQMEDILLVDIRQRCTAPRT